MMSFDRKKVLLLAATLVLCFFILELGSYYTLRHSVEFHLFDADKSSRYLHIFTNDSEVLPYGIKANYDQEQITREMRTTIHINNVGLREDFDYFGESIDIAFVGDSFTFGQGVNSGERYSDVLRTYFPDKQIVSLSYLNGYTTPHYYLFLKHNPQFIPRILIVGLFPKNDLAEDIVDTDLQYDPDGELISAKSFVRIASEEGFIIDKRQGRNVEEKKVKFTRNLLLRTNLGKVILLISGRIKGNIIDVDKKLRELKPIHKGELNETNLTALEFAKKLQSYTSGYGTRVLVFIIPENFLVGDYPKTALYTPELCAELMEHKYMQASLKEWFQANGIEYIDPTERFQELEREGTKLYYKYDGHWNQNGHAAAAQLIYEYLSRAKSPLSF
jgi:hypothetical protein